MRDHHVFFSTLCQGKLKKANNSEVKTSWTCRLAKRKVTKKSTLTTTQNASTPPNTQKRSSDQSSKQSQDKCPCRSTSLQLKRSTTSQSQIFHRLSSPFSNHFLPKTTTSTAGTTDSSTADAASSNATAKDNPPAASDANGLLQSQHPLTTSLLLSLPSLEHRLASPPPFLPMRWTHHPKILVSCLYACSATTSL